jgi:DNA-binding transcriptional LysR family regulator
MLLDGVVKVGLITWPFFSSEIVPLLRFREPLILVAPAGHALTQSARVTLNEVERQGSPFLLVRWGSSMNSALSRIDLQTAPLVEVPVETVLHLLSHGIGVAFITRTLVKDDLAAGRLIEVTVADLPPLFRDSALVRLTRGGALPAAITNFVETLREEADEFVLSKP